ncbi:uncharacterized protein LOC111713685 isoform X2 [Eurytemora carolleeae]|uniref:uncharacterized protein LOC111713685 isoform X2 n=1 Tax=Eurytemora carolleeae TaxID=1294199 RepID=UPI000C767A5C|nr:uncharacterized protein LOC111713685 isoform X2 [Eurytemora carolleeae]|eukprot:XP_023344386.1 uncharacterized protein LOC111713685 isoform X2 [Eurytemora affinis]
MTRHEMSKSKVARFFRKYFLEGQKLDETAEKALKELPEDAPWSQKLLVKHRRLVGILIPLTFVQLLWWMQAIRFDYFSLFPDRYLMSITMVFGASVAGMTSEGGGAVAFPVMTLALAIAPEVARDFSLMIQSIGMTSASFTILWMKIKLEYNSILFCGIGATGGIILGIEVIDGLLSGPVKKLGFVCIWFSFAFSLFLLNREHKRKTFDKIQNMTVWKRICLILAGVIGGKIQGGWVFFCDYK